MAVSAVQLYAQHETCHSAVKTDAHSLMQLHSSQEFQDVIEQNPGRLVVLMCKAQGCRPCKMFTRKFQRMSEQYQDAIFLDIMGDETKDTRVNLKPRSVLASALHASV